jgi:hypothetical protein
MLAALAFDALAQSAARSRPPGTLPLDEIPPPLPLTETSTPQPEVTTRTEGDQTIQEYRIKGKLYMTRVTPKHGRPYILMDQRGDGTFSKLDNTLDGQVRVPQWVLLEF